MRQDDNQRQGFFQYAFQLDWNDPQLYDLIINTGKMSLATAADLIAEAATRDEMKACSLGALTAMECMSMERKVRAALLKNNINPKMIFIEVPEVGVVIVRGISKASQIKDRIVAIIEGIPGVDDVKAEISFIDGDYA